MDGLFICTLQSISQPFLATDWGTQQVALNVHQARQLEEERATQYRAQISTLQSLLDRFREPSMSSPSVAQVDRELMRVGLKPRDADTEARAPDLKEHVSWMDAWRARKTPEPTVLVPAVPEVAKPKESCEWLSGPTFLSADWHGHSNCTDSSVSWSRTIDSQTCAEHQVFFHLLSRSSSSACLGKLY